MADTKGERTEQEESGEQDEKEERDEGSQGSGREDRDEGSEGSGRSEGSGQDEESEGSGQDEESEGSGQDEESEGSGQQLSEEYRQHEEPEEEAEPHELSQDELVGMQVIDPHGDKIGKIDALFIHQQEERASWARVKTGIGPLGSHVFIPLHDAQDDDGKIRVVYEKGHVDEAPEIEPEGNEISDEEADQLHSYYGLERVTGLATETKDEDIELPREAREANPPTMDEPPWAVEKYPLPDMDRDNVREEGDEGDEGEENEAGDREEAPEDREGEAEDGQGEAEDREGEAEDREGEAEDREGEAEDREEEAEDREGEAEDREDRS